MVLHTPINNVGHRIHSGTDNIQQIYTYVQGLILVCTILYFVFAFIIFICVQIYMVRQLFEEKSFWHKFRR